MEETGNWQREHSLETEWAGAGGVFFALFCSDGERAENSTKQAELLGGYTAYGEAIGPTGARTLSTHRRTRYAHVVHKLGIYVRGRPEEAIRAYPAS